MRRVLLATPAYDSRMDARYVHSFGQSIKACIEQGIDLRWLFPWNDQLSNARNGLHQAAVKYGFDDIIWADSDQDWEGEWIPKLLNYPVDCVGAAVRRKTDDDEIYNVKAAGGPHTIITDPKTGLMTSPDMALGFGLLRMSRKALMALWDDAADKEYTVFLGKEPLRWIYDLRPHNGELRGEDTLACDRLRELGIQTWVDPHMNAGHIGLKRYVGDFAATLERWKAEAKPALRAVK